MIVSCNLQEKQVWNSWQKHKSLMAVISLIILIGVSLSNTAELNFKAWYYLYSMLIYGAVSMLIIVFFVILAGISPAKHLSKIWMSLDRCSMGIYIIHHILIMYLLQYRTLKNFMVCHYVIMPFLLFFLLLFASWGITALMQKTPLKKIM